MRRIPLLVRRNNTFWFRTRLSGDLTAIIGRREVTRSLHTGDIAEARRRVASLTTEWLDIMATVARGGLSREQVAALVNDFVNRDLEAYRGLERAAGLNPALMQKIAWEKENYRREAKWWSDALMGERDGFMRPRIADYLEARGLDLERGGPAYQEFLVTLTPAMIDLIHAIQNGAAPAGHDKGARVIAPLNGAPIANQAADEQIATKAAVDSRPCNGTGAEVQREQPRMVELARRYLDERVRGGVQKSYAIEIKTALSWFEQWITPEKGLGDLTREDLRDYKDCLLALPSNWSKKLPGLSIREAAAHNADGCMPKLELDSMIGKRWQPVASFVAWAHDNRQFRLLRKTDITDGVEYVVGIPQ